MVSAIAAAMSLASVANATLPSDCDINLTVALAHCIFLQPQAFVAHMRPIGEMKFVTVPRTNDVHVGFIISLPEENAALPDLIHDLRHLQPFAGRTALMRAKV